MEDYKEQLMLLLDKIEWNDVYPSESIQYWTDTFQSAIDKGNENAQRHRKRINTFPFKILYKTSSNSY